MKELDFVLNEECRMCGESQEIRVNKGDYEEWNNGGLVQDTLGYLSAGEREMLISHTCDACWEKIYGE